MTARPCITHSSCGWTVARPSQICQRHSRHLHRHRAGIVFVGGRERARSQSSENSAAINLEPGNYAVVCVVDIPDHVPHVAKGMIHALKVTAIDDGCRARSQR